MTRLEYALCVVLVLVALAVTFVLLNDTRGPRLATCYAESGEVVYTGRVCFVYSQAITLDEMIECESNRRVQVNLDQCVIVSDP